MGEFPEARTISVLVTIAPDPKDWLQGMMLKRHSHIIESNSFMSQMGSLMVIASAVTSLRPQSVVATPGSGSDSRWMPCPPPNVKLSYELGSWGLRTMSWYFFSLRITSRL